MQVAYKDTITVAKVQLSSTEDLLRIELEPMTNVGGSTVIYKLEEAQPATEKVGRSHTQWNKAAAFLADLFAVELNARAPGGQEPGVMRAFEKLKIIFLLK